MRRGRFVGGEEKGGRDAFPEEVSEWSVGLVRKDRRTDYLRRKKNDSPSIESKRTSDRIPSRMKPSFLLGSGP